VLLVDIKGKSALVRVIQLVVHIKMRIRILIAFSIFPLLLCGQNSADYETKFEYYEDGSVKMEYKIFKGQKVDTLKAYDAKGRLESLLYFGDYASTEPIYREDYYYKGASRKTRGYYVMKLGSEPLTVGVQKSYWKNGNLMDSVIYNSEGQRLYRARFGKNGELQFED
jgi:antitoxin component YwqK of YwqJK toxin-antitoxin module